MSKDHPRGNREMKKPKKAPVQRVLSPAEEAAAIAKVGVRLPKKPGAP